MIKPRDPAPSEILYRTYYRHSNGHDCVGEQNALTYWLLYSNIPVDTKPIHVKANSTVSFFLCPYCISEKNWTIIFNLGSTLQTSCNSNCTFITLIISGWEQTSRCNKKTLGIGDPMPIHCMWGQSYHQHKVSHTCPLLCLYVRVIHSPTHKFPLLCLYVRAIHSPTHTLLCLVVQPPPWAHSEKGSKHTSTTKHTLRSLLQCIPLSSVVHDPCYVSGHEFWTMFFVHFAPYSLFSGRD